MNLVEITKVWKKVYSNWKYVVLTLVVAFVFYSINATINNWGILSSVYPTLGTMGTLKLFFILTWGFGETIKLHSYVSLVIVSILFGFLFSLISYKTIMIKSTTGRVGVIATVGIFLGALAPGCAACGVGLLSVLGLSAAFITYLPYEGLELSILSILILSFSVFRISEGIHIGTVCEIKLNKNSNEREQGSSHV